MKRFLIALQFLTTLPIKIKSEIKNEDFGKSLLYFPIVGMLIGLLLSLILSLFNFLPHLVLGVFILLASFIITGGIHLDGFADTCDGFYGSKPKKKILEIMRDSRVGTMGVTGLVCLLLLKFALIVNTPKDMLWKLLIMMTAFARLSQVLACYTSGYARQEGKAKYFIEYALKKDAVIGALFTLSLFLWLMQIKGVALFLIPIPLIFLFINYIKKRINGMTGDTIGAVSELAEVSILLSFLVINRLYI
ncbi:MAG: adenosylcobinamide-GDP ribazoletransferase [Candidatus Omnitrophica bacterium]|nr:adenosylcobinamide-GDP ribazoletransferase [Candidatus Omnitrophota bacterium]